MIDHTTINGKCPQCKRDMNFCWKDKAETSGISETRYGANEVCFECMTKQLGREPKSLQMLKKEANKK